METSQKKLFDQIFRPPKGREGHKKWFEIVHWVHALRLSLSLSGEAIIICLFYFHENYRIQHHSIFTR